MDVRSLGADEVIDYRITDYTRRAQPYDWIVDVDVHHPLRRWGRALKPGGVYLAEDRSSWWTLSLLFWQPILKLTYDKTRGLMLHWEALPPTRPGRAQALGRLRLCLASD